MNIPNLINNLQEDNLQFNLFFYQKTQETQTI